MKRHFRLMTVLGFSAILIGLMAFSWAYADPATAEVRPSLPAQSMPATDLDIVGFWYTENREGGVELYDCNDKICGRLYWFSDAMKDGTSVQGPLDTHNFDPDKRKRPLCQMQFMTGFVADGPGHYAHGQIYSPRSGQSFSGEITVVDHDTLKLRGYVLTPMLGASQTWKRAADLPACNDG